MPQSKELLTTTLPVIKLWCVAPVSSLSRMPPALFATELLATVEWSTPVKMDALAAVEILRRLEVLLAGAQHIDRVEALVVVENAVACDRHPRRIRHHDSLEVGVLDSESGDDHAREAWVIDAVDVDPRSQTGGVDHGVAGARAEERKRFANDHVLVVRARRHLYGFAGGRRGYGGVNGGITASRAARIDTQPFGTHRFAQGGHQRQSECDPHPKGSLDSC